MNDSTDSRVVCLTGANEGIGYHMSRTLLDDGFRVAGLDVRGGNVRSLGDEYGDRVRFHECDVATDAVEAAVDEVIDRWGRIDVFVNNAAVFTFAPFDEQTMAETRREFEVNYFGYVRAIRAVLPHMRARGGGTIHNVSSGAGIVGHPGLTGYASTKGAIEALVRSLRLELRNEDVHCTLMHPALSNTRSTAELGYPASALRDPADVGRKLARKVDSTGPVVYADWTTRIGIALARRFPSLVQRGTERFVDTGTTDTTRARRP